MRTLGCIVDKLSNSRRHLLAAQVLTNDRLTNTESLRERVAESQQKLTGTVDKLAGQLQILADGQKHGDARIDALADMVRHMIDRNGKHLQQP